jgi:hypothetical protein
VKTKKLNEEQENPHIQSETYGKLPPNFPTLG